MRNNFTGDGTHNNWYNVRSSSQDSQDDGLANNGSQSIRFVINHDDGKGDANNQNNDYIVLDNVAHAWTLFQPGNSYVYFNGHEFDRTGNTTFFLKDGRGDALGGMYGTIITTMLDIRNSYGRGNFQERFIDPGGSSAIYAFELTGSMLVGLNIGYNPNSATRTMATSFTPGQHLVELTGNWQDPSGTVLHTVTVGSGGTVTINIPWDNANNGNKGYVVYVLPRPQGSISLTNVSQTLAPDNTGNNATDRLTAIDVITGNSFNVNVNTTAVTLTDGYRDHSADGDRGYLKVDGGLDLNNNGHVDFTSQSDTRYGFENFSTTNSPGYNNANGNGVYAQSIDSSQLSEGYHYITSRVYRQRSDGGPDIYTDLKKVIYVDRIPPSSQIAGLTQIQVGNTKNVNVQTRSLDLTADNVQVFTDLGSALTDQQVLAMINSNSASTQTDRDLFSKDFTNVTTGTHVLSIVTREITGNYAIVRATGYQVTGGTGLGFGDLDANGAVNSSDISQFQTVLQSNNTQFNAGAEANTDGQIDLADTFLLGPRLSQLNVDASTQTAYQNLIHSAYVTSGTYTVNANHTVFDVTAGATHVTAGNTLTARSIRGNSLVIDSGAVATIQPLAQSGSASVLSSLSITGTGQFDLNDTALVVNYGTETTHATRDAIRNLLKNGRNAGAAQAAPWNGAGGIISTYAHNNGNGFNLALGYADNADLASVRASGSYTSFGGQTVASNTVLVQLTRGADATLDGIVDGQDVAIIGTHFQKPSSGQWCFGDFDYSGTCDGSDVAVLGTTFGKTSPILSPAQMTAEFGSAFTAAFDARQGDTLPEPGILTMLGLSGMAMVGKRRRRIPGEQNQPAPGQSHVTSRDGEGAVFRAITAP